MNSSKIKLELNDVLYLQNKLKASGKELVDNRMSEGLMHQKDLVQKGMDEWISNIIQAVSSNVDFTDAEGVDAQAVLRLSDPIDERLKAKVNAKEAELNTYINQAVTARMENPIMLSNIAKDICKSQSQQTEELQITASNNVQAVSNPVLLEDSVKRDYRESMHLLTTLSSEISKQINKVERVDELTRLSKE